MPKDFAEDQPAPTERSIDAAAPSSQKPTVSAAADGAIVLGRERSRPARRQVGFAAAAPTRETVDDLLVDDTDGHLMTFAPTGAGKGVSYAIPTLLSYDGSIVALDPKGELAAVTARARRERGHSVAVIDPFGVSGAKTSALNPFDLIDADAPNAVDDCLSLAHSVANDIGVKDPFWDERARQLIMQTMLYVCAQSPPTLRNMSEVWRLLNQSRREFDVMAKAMARSKNPQVAQGSGMITTCEPRVLTSIISSAQRFLEPFRGAPVRESIARTDVPTEGFIAGAPTTVYLVMPPERLRSHAAVLRLWISTLFSMVLKRAARVETPTLFLIDEAAQLGRMEEIVTAMTLLRGYGVKAWTFWQDPQQLEATYPAEWRTLFNNARAHIAFGAMTPMAARMAARLFATTSGAVEALEPDEAMVMVSGKRVKTVARIDYRTDPSLSDRAEPNPRHTPRAPVSRPRVRIPALSRPMAR